MKNIDFIQDRETFMPLWRRARVCTKKIGITPASELLHFDSSNLCTQIFHELIRKIANLNGTGEFAVIVLDPDPFSYFNHRFGKFPGFIVKAHHSEDDFADMLMEDPGGSPADAIGFYSEQYAILPISGEWFMYADRDREGGTGVLSGSQDIMKFARDSFGFYENPEWEP